MSFAGRIVWFYDKTGRAALFSTKNERIECYHTSNKSYTERRTEGARGKGSQ
jgi:hypothetical protein